MTRVLTAASLPLFALAAALMLALQQGSLPAAAAAGGVLAGSLGALAHRAVRVRPRLGAVALGAAVTPVLLLTLFSAVAASAAVVLGVLLWVVWSFDQ